MTKIIWNIDSEYGSALFGSLAYDTVTDISETGFTLTKGSFETVFTGTFQLDDAGAISGGTVTGFKAYSGQTLQLDASGYQVDFDSLTSALGQYQTHDPEPIYDLFIDQPKTIYRIYPLGVCAYLGYGGVEERSLQRSDEQYGMGER